MAASIEQLLADIWEVEDPVDELKTLNTALLTAPLNSLKETAPGLRLGVIFSLLNTSDREQINLCVSILDRILQALEPVYIAQNFREELQRGLLHPDDSVKILALSQAARTAENPDAVTDFLNSPELLRLIIQCIGGEQLSVAKQAIKAISRIAETKAGLDAIFMGSYLQDLKNVMATDDIVRYRVYELIVEISNASPVSLGYCANSGFISQLITELTGDDILIRATCIETVTALAHSIHGRQYLAQQGVIDKISNMMIGAESDPFSSFYLPGLVKFFGNLAIVDSPQHICEHYPVFLEKVFEMGEGQDPTLNGVALDTLAILASSVEGKQVLQKTGQKFQNLLKKIGHVAKNAPTELRVRCLDAITSILSLPTDQQTDDLLGMTESWFSSLSSQPMELFRSISTQPFTELHCSALRVFAAIADQPWGQKFMINSPGFVEYILDRSVDHDKESKDAKYELVKALVNSNTIADIFGNQHYLRLRAYLREGPYYVRATASVALEGAE
ncbi:26S proteasome non-ATPase regulatory subunit 5 isoform X2 [Protopterus annectens]|uniref:26S proteasome non-ATPase regulatory subunit 5 isoform X2 n=1 Tax=Protopterus annectens TaxID=7888 RepID=UPI001CF9B689|nr:26S proteasome non-ATPase regulatory subunit 5 isoform X2 [Protopterus annectens]